MSMIGKYDMIHGVINKMILWMKTDNSMIDARRIIDEFLLLLLLREQ